MRLHTGSTPACWFYLCVHPDFILFSQAEDVRHVADSELGFQQVSLSRPTQAKTYLFINTERLVVGCLVAEPIRQVQTWLHDKCFEHLIDFNFLPWINKSWFVYKYLSVPAGLQSPRAAGSTKGYDKGRLYGATQGLVLLHCPRTSSVWNQSDLGLQSGQTTGNRNPYARHRQVSLNSYVI